MTVFEGKNIGKAILRLGFPAMLTQLTTLIYNTADTYFVSLTKNPDQIAAVTLSTPILLIIMSIACIFGMGGSSVIARLLGEDNKEDSRLCFQFSTWAILTLGVIVTVLGMLCVSPIARAIGTDERTFLIPATICAIFSLVRRLLGSPTDMPTCSARPHSFVRPLWASSLAMS